MSKIDKNLNKQFFNDLTGSLDKSKLDVKNKKMGALWELVNTHVKDNKIDIREITDFANSVFAADTNHDGNVTEKELKEYIKSNPESFKEADIKAKDILEFLNLFKNEANKEDHANTRINNSDGSYSIEYTEEIKEEVKQPQNNKQTTRQNTNSGLGSIFGMQKPATSNKIKEEQKPQQSFKNTPKYNIKKIPTKLNYDAENNLISTEVTNGNQTTVTAPSGEVIKTITKQGNLEYVIEYSKNADGLKEEIISYTQNGQPATGKDIVKNIYTAGNEITQTITTDADGNIKSEKNYQNKTLVSENVYDTEGNLTQEITYKKGKHKKIKNADGTITYQYSSVMLSPGAGKADSLESYNRYLANATELRTLNWMGTGVIDMVINSNDLFEEDKSNYINKFINRAVIICENKNIACDELQDIQKEISEKGIENINIDDLKEAYGKVIDRPTVMENLGINFLIDKGIEQGNRGDCWFLAPLKKIARQYPDVLKDTFKMEKDGNISVKFKGASRKIVITPEEFKKFQASTGDPDVKLLELALSKLGGFNNSNINTGGYELDAYTLLLGRNNGKRYEGFIYDNLLSQITEDNTIACISGHDKGEMTYTYNGKDYILYPAHAYMIEGKNNDNDCINLFNPHGEVIPCPIKIVQKFFNQCDYMS